LYATALFDLKAADCFMWLSSRSFLPGFFSFSSNLTNTIWGTISQNGHKAIIPFWCHY
jgi:hypothetical protein